MRAHSPHLLITGAQSGIGRFLHENLSGVALTRENAEEILSSRATRDFEVIVHCAFNRARNANQHEIPHYLEDNLFLTRRLLSLPHRKFIYFSSVDVYPKFRAKANVEHDLLDLGSTGSLYGTVKLMNESLVERTAKSPLILRPTSLLGVYGVPRSLDELLRRSAPQLSLSARSNVNFILYSDVLRFIQIAMAGNLCGKFNLSSAKNVSVEEMARRLGKEVRYGNYLYEVGKNSNDKAMQWLPGLENTSLETLGIYLRTERRLIPCEEDFAAVVRSGMKPERRDL